MASISNGKSIALVFFLTAIYGGCADDGPEDCPETACDIATATLEGATGVFVGVFASSDASDSNGCFACRTGETTVSYFTWDEGATLLEAIDLQDAEQRRVESVTLISDDTNIGHIICVTESRGDHCIGFSTLEANMPALVSVALGADEWAIERFSPSDRSVVEVWIN